MRNRLIEIIKNASCCSVDDGECLNKTNKDCEKCGKVYIAEEDYGKLADYLLANGVIVPPCKVGDTVYYVSDSPLNLSVQANTIYEADVSRIITTRYGTTLVIQIHNSYGCTEIPDVNDWGKTVFLTKEEAEQALKGGAE